MYKKVITSVCVVFFASIIYAQDITLPEPQQEDSVTLNQALLHRKSCRSFDDTKELSNQQIANLLWAAYGFNREGKRTVPSGFNSQEYTLYVFTKKGTYAWNAQTNVLEQVSKGDKRASCGKQEYVKYASLNIVYVADYSKLVKYETPEAKTEAVNVDCGFIGQNVYLHCASKGLACIFRGWIDKELLHKILKLNKNQKVMYSQSVGFEK